MAPIDTLGVGADILASVLTPHGFMFRIRETGRGRGGDFAAGKFVRDDRWLELHFRGSLGLVTYHVATDLVGHEDYMRGLGVLAGQNRYPGFSDDPCFRRRDYERMVALLDALEDPKLLDPSERKALALARRRIAI